MGVGRLVSIKSWWFSGSMLILQRVNYPSKVDPDCKTSLFFKNFRPSVLHLLLSPLGLQRGAGNVKKHTQVIQVMDIWRFPKMGYPLCIINFNKIFPWNKPSILGYLHLWKPPFFWFVPDSKTRLPHMELQATCGLKGRAQMTANVVGFSLV